MKLELNRRELVEVADLAEASKRFQEWRDANGYGNSDLQKRCGYVYDDERNVRACVSYNGRVWTVDGQLIQERTR